MIKHNGSIERGGGFSYKSQSGATMDMREEPKAKGKLSGAVQIESRVSVSWRVPRKNRNELPDLHSDYSRPRTRPPCHN